MLQSTAKWRILAQDDERAAKLASSLSISMLVARLLVQRGIHTVEAANVFLQKETPAFYDPYLLKGMKEVVERICKARDQGEKVLVFGDYDADGVSATALLVTALKMAGARCDYYIPNRFTEGYGPNKPALIEAKSSGYQLVVTVDTGISAVEEAACASEIGLDFIITDHHEVPPKLPDAYAIVNPKQPGCPYPFKELAGAGVAFKVAQALLGDDALELLDYAVIGTVADLVPLVDENRFLVKKGLRALEASHRPGIQALKTLCGARQKEVDADVIGFGIGPRLNAAGRLDSAEPAVALLLATDKAQAKTLAEEIEQYNQMRQSVVDEMTKEAIMLVEAMQAEEVQRVIIVAKEGWNPGVVGIVASRLVEKFYRPTIVLSLDKEKGLAKGSARSIAGFDIFSALSKNRDLLPHFGGHPMAAGLTMALADVTRLQARLDEYAQEVLTETDFTPTMEIDLVAKVSDVTLEVTRELQQLAPFGVGNRKPLMLLTHVSLGEMRQIGSELNHLKCQFVDGDTSLDAVAFRKGHLYEEMTPQATLSVVGTAEINEWNGHVKPQFLIKDVAVSHWQLFDWRSIQAKQLNTRLAALSDAPVLPVAFQSTTLERLHLTVDVIHHQGEQQSLNGTYIVFLDLPDSRDDFMQFFRRHEGVPHRIYVVFSEEEEAFFRTNPNREQFKWYYAFLQKRGTFAVGELAKKLEAHRGWSAETVAFMTTVFEELGFITVERGVVRFVSDPIKKSLEDSPTFRKKQEQTWLEQMFVYASYEQLKTWFDQVIEPARVKEGAK
ncbi:single-stranded-DNA-specific exonuclease RecJ [Shouchella lonarensis]|uniref:Single-stranded-DNA-specific exonuclease RecJ n=1 Tax=Shouchella lonarensis TaxID=1464122 RepID=A0A1G6JP29_9BACI|nr:single-stranded-DNA-specific exonuclease RecJ [Shouchella lonarensis]SDC20512.1 exonuclease RecJ [Shouchella lonarensis]